MAATINATISGANANSYVTLAEANTYFETVPNSTHWDNKTDDKNVNGEIIHKGISQRQFARSFTIADDVKVSGAELKDGLLTVACERIVPEYKKKKLIEIK